MYSNNEVNTDRIIIKGLHLYGYHGVHDFEKRDGQNFYINAELFVDTKRAGETDRLEDTVSYSEVCRLFETVFGDVSNDLIERAAEKLAEAALLNFSGIRRIVLEVQKPEAPIGLDVQNVSVCITRGWRRVYLAVGSNMGDRRSYIDKAVKALRDDEKIRVIRISDIISTKPYGGVAQDDFLNGVIEIDTLYSPEGLLKKIGEIEAYCGRERIQRWGPRTLDLDILLYEDLIMDSRDLTIPHPDMQNRDFVLIPLSQLAPHLIHPVEGISILNMLKRLEEKAEKA